MFTQPNPVLSLGYELWSPNLRSQPPLAPAGEQTSLSGWWVLVGTILCAGISPLCPLHPCCCALLRGSETSPLPTPCPRQWRGFLVCGNLSSFTAPSHWCRSHPYSLVSVFSYFFFPTQVRGEFLAFCEVWGLLPAFSRCSVGAVPHVGVFLMYLWGGRWSPHFTPLPSWRSSKWPFMVKTMKSKLEGCIKSRRWFILLDTHISTTQNALWSNNLWNAFNRNLHGAADFIFWEHLLLGNSVSVEKSFHLYFLILFTALIWSLCYV